MLRIDYYAAPNCNALCSSGSGTPKANGTQECNCKKTIDVHLSSECWMNENKGWNFCGYESSGRGGISSTAYRDSNIVSFYSNTSARNTHLTLLPVPNDKSDIKVRVNGNTFTCKYARFGKSWSCPSAIFSVSKMYTIEFLN